MHCVLTRTALVVMFRDGGALLVRARALVEMTRRLAREEALFAGTSGGANVVAAIRVARRLGPGAKVVTLLPDAGLKYLTTDLYRRGGQPAGRTSMRLS